MRPPMQRHTLRPQPDQTSDQRSDSDEFVESEEASDSDEMEFPAPNIETSSESESEDTVDSTYYPSISDTLTVRYLLQWKVAAGGIPPEIVDMIIEAAEYWASTEARIDGKIVIRQDGDRELLRTAPLYHEKTSDGSLSKLLPHRLAHPCRKIVFSLRCHDQGWGGEPGCRGTYQGSYTWFDAEVVSIDYEHEESKKAGTKPGEPNFMPNGNKLQSNLAATGRTQNYTITWHHLDDIQPGTAEAEEIEKTQGRGHATLDGRRVREMRPGDSISVWARARFGAWANHVQALSVRVFWAV